HRVLFWGIIGAIIMRVVMIIAGAALITQFHWILYLFGIFLVVTGVRMLLHSKDSETSPADHPVMTWLRRHLPVSGTQLPDGRFFTRENGKRMVTPLFIVLIAVELTDLMFAVDSVPAIFAVTTDVFVVTTSNIFAILGLRSLYFALRGLASRLHYLKHGLAMILMLIGAKILLADIYPIPIAFALGATALILAVAVVASLLRTKEAVD
ncbi:MAG: TerC/Alx family metal homeostasis membrane protein, partial [Rhizomicrobium sp.]